MRLYPGTAFFWEQVLAVMKEEELPREFLDFVKRFAGSDYMIHTLAGDASTRTYYRVDTGKKTWILCHDGSYTPLTEKNHQYLIIHALFKENGIPVPEISATDPEQGLLLLEDLGDILIQHLVPGLPPGEKREIYEKTIDCLIQVQGIKGKEDPPFGRAFDTEKLMYEFEFFVTHTLLGLMGLDLSGPLRKELLARFKKISDTLNRPEYFVLNHRDFHSRNIMYHKEGLYFIDFQDARMGLPQYDLVSLLRDSYIVLDTPEVDRLKEYYYEKSRSAGIQQMGRDEFEFLFDLSAFQRNVKAMGSFGFHAHANGKEFYAGFIPPTLKYLEETVDRREELRAAGGILKKVIPAKYYIA
jgi:aminoglycoside/choline kinase family phosphotransferase